jgi:hypothetical protein
MDQGGRAQGVIGTLGTQAYRCQLAKLLVNNRHQFVKGRFVPAAPFL